MLEVCNISVILDEQSILQDVSFVLNPNEILMVTGPNGSGKTTLVRAIMGMISHDGQAILQGNPISSFPRRDLARKIAVLTQGNAPQFAYTVEDLVAVGRYAHSDGWMSGLQPKDHLAIEQAMELTRIAPLRHRSITTLSGGELQRAYLARALAQQPEILILDEPTNHLDIQHQLLLFDIIRDWVSQDRRAVLSIVHDLNLALTYADRALLLHHGKVYAQGIPDEVFSKSNLSSVYQMDLAHWMQQSLARWQQVKD